MKKYSFAIAFLAAFTLATPAEAQQRVPVRTTTNFVQFSATLCQSYTASDRVATLSNDGFFATFNILIGQKKNLVDYTLQVIHLMAIK